MKVVERMAKSIYEARNGAKCRAWNSLPQSHRDPYLSDALAALKAMFEPTEEMLGRGRHYYDKTNCGLTDGDDPLLAAWDEMISTAIKEAEAG